MHLMPLVLKKKLTVSSSTITTIVISKSAGHRKGVWRNERYVSAGSSSRAGRIPQRRLDEGTSLSIEAAATRLEVGNGANERSIRDIVSASRQDSAVLDEGGLNIVSVSILGRHSKSLTVPRPQPLSKWTTWRSAATPRRLMKAATRVK